MNITTIVNHHDQMTKALESGLQLLESWSNTANLEWENHYYWQITGIDAFGNEVESEIFTFYNNYPPMDFSKSALRVLPNYVGPNDDELVKIYQAGKLFPLDLKNAVAKYIIELLKPVKQHFIKNKKARELYDKVKSYEITR